MNPIPRSCVTLCKFINFKTGWGNHQVYYVTFVVGSYVFLLVGVNAYLHLLAIK